MIVEMITMTLTKDILENEIDLYRRVWDIPRYGVFSPGERSIDRFLAIAGKDLQRRQTILDAGCGSGKASVKLHQAGLLPTMLDFVADCSVSATVKDYFTGISVKDKFSPIYCGYSLYGQGSLLEVLPVHDWFYCCDVLEHIPEQYIDETLNNLAGIVSIGGYFSVSCVPDGFGRQIGETLHKTVRNYNWWFNKISKYFNIVKSTGGNNSTFYVKKLTEDKSGVKKRGKQSTSE